MRVVAIALGVALAGSVALAGWLWSDNRDLQAELAKARAAKPPPASRREDAVAGPSRSFFGSIGRAIDQVDPSPQADKGTPPGDGGSPDWEARRARRQERIRNMLGRRPGESEQAYRDRVSPLVTTALAYPRDRVGELRKDFEEAAKVTSDQAKKMDQVFADAYAEVMSTANDSIAKGEISPYHRSTRGILSFVGGTVAVVDAVDSRLQQILTPEQLAAADATGFDLVEYLAVTAPWETLNPPPPE